MGLTARQMQDQRNALLAALDAEDDRIAAALDEERYPSPEALEYEAKPRESRTSMEPRRGDLR